MVKKENHLGLMLGIEGIVPINMGTTVTRKNNTITNEIWNSELKVKEERIVKESDIWEKRESRVYMAKLARITMNPFSSSKHTLCNLQKMTT